MLSPSTLTIDNCSAFAILLSLKLIELQVHSFFELTSLQDEMHSLSPSRNSNLQYLCLLERCQKELVKSDTRSLISQKFIFL